MRIIIDLQGAQASNRNRGIGRYSQALAYHICKHAGEHEIHLLLSDAFSSCIEEIRALFDEVIAQERIHVISVLQPCSEVNPAHEANRKLNEAMREAYLAQLQPDIVLISSLFEGLIDDAVTSIKTFSNIPTAVVLYDLIPYINRRPYLENPVVETWYFHKVDSLKRADLLLSISASSGQEAVDWLGFDSQQVVNISTACDSAFRPQTLTRQDEAYLASQYGLDRPFVMYTGGIDHRKNIEGLIRAYAALPAEIRRQHQLAVVCSVHDPDRQRLGELARQQGLQRDDFVMTGFVPEADLIKLYNACKLFVFPSWHEGFGLPALEAMQCGRPVIASNNSSLPEVVGLDEALFDPRDDRAITVRMLQALTDDAFRERLAAHGLQQARKFNWDDIARTALDAIARFDQPVPVPAGLATGACRPRLAFLSPLPPERSGISDYSAELLEELTRWYEVDVIIDQAEVSSGWVNATCGVRTVDWFRQNSHQFDRVLYHFGNSEFHKHMFELLDTIPGVVVLHDFYLSGIQCYRAAMGWSPSAWKQSLYVSHGYPALYLSENETYLHEAIWTYPANLDVIQNSLGVIVHSASSIRLLNQWYSNNDPSKWEVIPILRRKADSEISDKTHARRILNIEADTFLICSFGMIGKNKHSLKLIEAFQASKLFQEDKCKLVFVGASDQSEYGQQVNKVFEENLISRKIYNTGWTDEEKFKLYLQAADVGVQLRTLSRGETSAAMLDCMSYGLPTIVNLNGSMADLDDGSVLKIQDNFKLTELVEALELAYHDDRLRSTLSKVALKTIDEKHNKYKCALKYFETIERFYDEAQRGFEGLTKYITNRDIDISESTLIKLSTNFPREPRQKCLYVDISELSQRDSKSGIQRVVRSILINLAKAENLDYRIEPIYADVTTVGYRHARKFMCSFLGINPDWATDEPIEPRMGDIFLGLDLNHHVTNFQSQFIGSIKNKGVKIFYVVYDLLPILQSEHFVHVAYDLHSEWLRTISSADTLIAISQSAADELYEWLSVFNNTGEKFKKISINWFHLGADVESSVPSTGLPENWSTVIQKISKNNSFLMVGTIEPRKGHQQVLTAFESLWANGFEDIILIIVGKQGWMVEALIDKINSHPRLGRNLIWLDSISDEYLSIVYHESKCLISASYGEGFGLPLIEAAINGIPIIARDIPVFREVAGNHALFFDDTKEPEAICDAVRTWLQLASNNSYPSVKGMNWLSWHQSAEDLLSIITGEKPTYKVWKPDNFLRFWGNDPRTHSQVGERSGIAVRTNFRAGFLVYGPYQFLSQGTYEISVFGRVKHLSGSEFLELTHTGGNAQIKQFSLNQNRETNPFVKGEFSLDKSVNDFEIRLWVDTDTVLDLERISIHPKSSDDAHILSTGITLDIVAENLERSSVESQMDQHNSNYYSGKQIERELSTNLAESKTPVDRDHAISIIGQPERDSHSTETESQSIGLNQGRENSAFIRARMFFQSLANRKRD